MKNRNKNISKIVVPVLIAIVAILLFMASLQPDVFSVTRSATFNAPAGKVFAQINEAKNWEAWSPWAKLDPNGKFTYEGPAKGVGAVTHWDGNSKMGAGTSTITESVPNKRIAMRLDFTRPMKATDTTEFTFRTLKNQTDVTWTMTGKNNFMGKLINLVFNCQKIVGAQFDQGLANIKAIVEKK